MSESGTSQIKFLTVTDSPTFQYSAVKSKVDPVHAINAYRRG
jgi:hypothetical protein